MKKTIVRVAAAAAGVVAVILSSGASVSFH